MPDSVPTPADHSLQIQQLFVRRARRVARLDDDVIELLYGGEIPGDATTVQQVTLLQTCLNRFAPKAREIIWLRYHNVQKPEQIADRVGWTPNAVNVALAQARSFLLECLEHQLVLKMQP